MARYGVVTRKMKLSLQTVCKLGTLAHNKDFTHRDFMEYTGAPSHQMAALVRRGIIKRVGFGKYYPTAKGWNVIERSCRIKHKGR